jgi:hypothetical protein
MNKSNIKKIYHSIVPNIVKRYISRKRQDPFLTKIQSNILNYYDVQITDFIGNKEIDSAISFLRRNPLHIFPYDFIYKYDSAKINVFKDSSTKLNYVYLRNKKLFYPEGWSSENIQYSHSYSCLEQDKQSPHSYQDESINYGPNDVVVDAGSAEGNFSLEIVDKVKKVYLFECSEGWQKPLKKTFEPWGDKVEIIPLKLSSTEDLGSTTLDRFFENREPPTILKVDVDGDEQNLLEGSKRLLKEQSYLRIALCVYHKINDEVEFTNLLQDFNFKVKTSNGYMIFYLDEPLQEPYFRRALLFASKGETNL